jgi:methionyl-tRNA formyltransferase
MRILLVGQAAFAERVLQGLMGRGDGVVAVYCPPDRPGAKPDPVKVRAGEMEIPVLIGIPRLGTICFHPSLLPRYRGGSAINWQIIKGETHTGVTVFWTDAGIDTGPILLQKEAGISPDASAGSLYYDTIFPLGIEAVLEAVVLIDAGRAPRIPQDERVATYDPLCRDEHAEISWNRPAHEVYNLIRGCDPQPGAFTRVGGKKIRLYDAALEPDRAAMGAPGAAEGGPAGAVVGISPEGLRIAVPGGIIRVKRVRADGEGGKIDAAEFARGAGLAPGTRL